MTKFSAHGRWFATSHSSRHQDLLTSLSRGPENISLASGEAVTDWRVRVWNVKTGQTQIDSSGPGVERMAFSPKTGLFAIRFRNRLVEVWNIANGEQLFQWQLSTPAAPEIVSVLEFTADGKQLAASIGTGQFELLQLDSINPELKKIGLGW